MDNLVCLTLMIYKIMKKELLIPVVWFTAATLIAVLLVGCKSVHCDAYGHNNIENGILSEDETSS